MGCDANPFGHGPASLRVPFLIPFPGAPHGGAQDLFQTAEMGSLPVNLPALPAAGKPPEITRGSRGDFVEDFPFGNRLQGAPAFQTAAKSISCPAKPETNDDFFHLPARVLGSHPITALDAVVFQQADIPRQNRPLLPESHADDFPVVIAVAVNRIGAPQPEKARKFSEMDVEDEFFALSQSGP